MARGALFSVVAVALQLTTAMGCGSDEDERACKAGFIEAMNYFADQVGTSDPAAVAEQAAAAVCSDDEYLGESCWECVTSVNGYFEARGWDGGHYYVASDSPAGPGAEDRSHQGISQEGFEYFEAGTCKAWENYARDGRFCSPDRTTSLGCQELALCPAGQGSICNHPLIDNTAPFGTKDSQLQRCNGYTEGDCDEETCCDLRGHCNDFKCPEGMAHTTPKRCVYHVCKDDVDVDTCCEPLATCDSYNCGSGFIAKDNQDSITCTSGPTWGGCADRDNGKVNCCDPLATCDSEECPSGYVAKDAPESIECAGAECKEADLDTCCDAQALCNSYNGDGTCPSGFIAKDNQEKYLCAGAACDTDSDKETCCDALATCDTYECPAGFIHKDAPESIECAGPGCAEPDKGTCCDAQAMCGTYGGDGTCPSGFIAKDSQESITCAGAACDPDSDKETCCDALATCDTYGGEAGCPSGYVAKEGSNSIECAGPECKEADKDACCVEGTKATCDSHDCDSGFVVKASPESISCAGTTCGNHDEKTCCEPKAKCDTYGGRGQGGGCPTGFTYKDAPENIECAGAVCEDSDKATCCDALATCETYGGQGETAGCPTGFVSKADPESITCAGPECAESDKSTCCDALATCDSYGEGGGCPTGFIFKEEPADITCAGVECAESDEDTCCDALATCDTYGGQGETAGCPAGFISKADPESITCAGPECAESDKSTCCDALATCDSYLCPEGFVAKSAKVPIECAGAKCVKSDTTTCCGDSVSVESEVSVKGITAAEFNDQRWRQTEFINSLKDSMDDQEVQVRDVTAASASGRRRRQLLARPSVVISFTLVKNVVSGSSNTAMAQKLADALESAVITGKLEEKLQITVPGITTEAAKFVKPTKYSSGESSGEELPLKSDSERLPTEGLVVIVVLAAIFVIATPLLLWKHSHVSGGGKKAGKQTQKPGKQTHPVMETWEQEPSPAQQPGDCL